MDDNKNNDNGDDFFRPFHNFGSFWSGGMDSWFSDINQQMDDLSRHMDEALKGFEGIHIGFHPPQMDGKSPPPLQEDPRSAMLKEPDKTTTTSVDKTELTGKSHSPVTSIGNQGGSISFFPSSDSFLTGSMRSVRTIRRSDGSVERIEKTRENGRTCTTVTTTDPDGHSTTTTTCDKPMSDSRLNMIKPESQDIPHRQSTEPGLSSPGYSHTQDSSMNNTGLFSKLFEKFGFGKSKS
ncbi:hypothetical protein ACF0H5_021972 [Mactra antiquata]